MTEVLRVDALEQTFEATTVLSDVSFRLEAGERVAVLGPSGSGKTTLVRLIAGLEAPTRGEIAIAGTPSSRAGVVLIPPERREVALVFQGLALFPHLRALDQIAFAARGRGGLARATELLGQVGLGHRASARLDELSGGERQRIALARALAQEPRLILMDEPFASLDDEKRAEMRELLRTLLARSAATLVLVTHSRDDAFDLARRVLVLERGRLVAQGPLEDVLARPRHAAAVRALGIGQVIEGQASGSEAATAFGRVVLGEAATGRVLLLVRPEQARIRAEGAEAEVVAIELRPPERREIRRVALVRAGGAVLRVGVDGAVPAVGERVRVAVEGAVERLEG
jgi:ABC-type Fe3+/spermidine/putrescine transport system ATPase subunit